MYFPMKVVLKWRKVTTYGTEEKLWLNKLNIDEELIIPYMGKK